MAVQESNDIEIIASTTKQIYDIYNIELEQLLKQKLEVIKLKAAINGEIELHTIIGEYINKPEIMRKKLEDCGYYLEIKIPDTRIVNDMEPLKFSFSISEPMIKVKKLIIEV